MLRFPPRHELGKVSLTDEGFDTRLIDDSDALRTTVEHDAHALSLPVRGDNGRQT